MGIRSRFGGVDDLEPLAAGAMVDAGALLLDVRELDEWQEGHAPEAWHLPLGELAGRLGELPEGKEIVVVCHLGGRSLSAATALAASGYRVHNLAGGMQAWQRSGLAVVNERGDPGRIA